MTPSPPGYVAPPMHLASRLAAGAIGFSGFVLMLGASMVASRFEPYHHFGWILRVLESIPVAIVYVALLVPVATLLIRDRSIRFGGLGMAVLFSLPTGYVVVGVANVVLDGSSGTPRRAHLISHEETWGRVEDSRFAWVDAPADTFTVSRHFVHAEIGGTACFRHHPGALGLDYIRPVPGDACQGVP